MAKFSKVSMLFFVFVILAFCNLQNELNAQTYYPDNHYNKGYTSFIDFDTINYSNKIGFSASSISFYGVTYQRFISPDWRLSGNALIYLSSNETDKDLMYNLGFSLHRFIIKDGRFNVYLLASAGYYYDKNEYTYSGSPIFSQDLNTTSCFNTGIGLGAGFQLTKYLAVDAEIGYMYSTETKNYSNNTPPQITYDKIVPAFGLGVYLCF